MARGSRFSCSLLSLGAGEGEGICDESRGLIVFLLYSRAMSHSSRRRYYLSRVGPKSAACLRTRLPVPQRRLLADLVEDKSESRLLE